MVRTFSAFQGSCKSAWKYWSQWPTHYCSPQWFVWVKTQLRLLWGCSPYCRLCFPCFCNFLFRKRSTCSWCLVGSCWQKNGFSITGKKDLVELGFTNSKCYWRAFSSVGWGLVCVVTFIGLMMRMKMNCAAIFLSPQETFCSFPRLPSTSWWNSWLVRKYWGNLWTWLEFESSYQWVLSQFCIPKESHHAASQTPWFQLTKYRS